MKEGEGIARERGGGGEKGDSEVESKLIHLSSIRLSIVCT